MYTWILSVIHIMFSSKKYIFPSQFYQISKQKSNKTKKSAM